MPNLATIERKVERLQERADKHCEKVAIAAQQVGDLDFTRYAGRPVEFLVEVLGCELTEEQVQICQSVVNQKSTNVQAAHGVGKSYLASRIITHWILAEQGLTITTAPTKRQVEQILWGEIRKTLNAGYTQEGELKNFPGDWGITYYRISEDARGFGFTATPTSSNAFQGIHAEKLLVVEDEANGISEPIDDGAVSCATGSKNRILRIGNPVYPNTPFEKHCKRSHIRIPVWNHPNVSWAYELHSDGVHRLKDEVAAAVIDPETNEVKDQEEWPDWCPRDVIPGAISLSYIEDTARPKGEGSAFWLARVEGLFPEDAAQSFIPRSYFLAARARYDANPEYWDALAREHIHKYGLDVGDMNDPHALATWRGPVLYAVEEKPVQGDDQDVQRAAHWAKNRMLEVIDPFSRIYVGPLKDKRPCCNVDRIGVGAGTLSTLKTERQQAIANAAPYWDVRGVHWGRRAKKKSQFVNLKAEHFWQLREGLENRELAIAPLGKIEERVMEELSSVYYEETVAEKIRAEDKKKTIERLGHSPNLADAVVMGKADITPAHPAAESPPGTFGYNPMA
jgi:hypothetical protein